MARTFQQIRDAIIAEKNLRPELDSIDLNSAVSEAGLWIDVTAESHRIVETFIDDAQAEIEAKLATQIVGTAPWYQGECLKFQLGDALQDDGKYATIDTSKQIITRAAVVEEEDGSLTIKVAKGATGEEQALSGGELNQFTNYMEKIKFAGTTVSPISLNPDQLKITATVYHDGIYSTAQMQERVQAALENFIQNRVTFNGKILVNRIIDELQDVVGLIDVEITDIRAIVGLNEFPFTREYATQAGYVKESEDFPFEDTITYVPQVAQ